MAPAKKHDRFLRPMAARRDARESRSGGGWGALLGLAFLLPGAGVLGWSLHVWGAARQAPPLIFGLLWGGAFATAGLVLLFGRAGFILDRQTGTAVTWYGLLGAWFRKERRLADFDRVHLRRELRRNKNGSHTLYLVELAGAGAPLQLASGQNLDQARQRAEALARYLEWPLHDESSGEALVRAPAELDEPLRERLRRAGGAEALPPAPAVMRCRLLQKDRSVRIDLPPPRGAAAVRAAFVVAAVLPLVILGVVLMPLLGRADRAAVPMVVVVLVVLGAVEALVLRTVLRRHLGPSRLLVSPEGVRLEAAGGRRGALRELGVDQIEEVVVFTPPDGSVNTGQAILIRGDAGTLSVGAGLEPAEAAYVAAVIRRTLSR